MKINKSQLREMIENKKPYIYNSSVAVIKDNEYIVYSYDTLILVYNIENDCVTYFNDKYYSITTSHLQNIIKNIFM